MKVYLVTGNKLIIEKSSNSSVAAMETLEEEVQNQPNELTPKRIKIDEEEEEDRISPMLDCLILEIISRLPTTKEAIRTEHSPSTYFSFVDKTIKKCRKLKLKKLELTSIYDTQFESLVNSWLHYAMDCNVEELTLVLWSKDMEAQFVLDKLFFISSSFTHLKLKDCILNPNGAISWNKLMSLSLQFVELDEDLIQNILSGCPILETLRLELCYGYTIEARYNFQECQEIGVLWLVLLNVSSLVKAKLNYRNEPELLSDEENEEMLKEFILSLRHVKELTIGKYCQKVLSRLEAKGMSVKCYSDSQVGAVGLW
ncbi:F-box protein-like protein [Tanacetum coccineum]